MRVLQVALGIVSVFVAATTVGCGNGNSVNSDEQARRAYLGLDKSISKSLALGFAGYNAATNANIPTEMAAGEANGSLKITGHVDQGKAGQTSMRLAPAMLMYYS